LQSFILRFTDDEHRASVLAKFFNDARKSKADSGMMPQQARVVSLHIASYGAAPMQSVTTVTAVAGRGIVGDRYFTQSGTYSNHPGNGRAVTLIEIEAIEALARECDVHLAAGTVRRNLVTHGVALNDFIGKTFTVGAVVLHGTRLCEPCWHLEKLAGKGVARGLIHRGGLRAEIVSGGSVQVGDAIAGVD
jgi:MOSC domain-containing protein YiiM